MSTAKLGDAAEIIMGQAPAGSSYNTENHGLPLIAGAGDFVDGRITPSKFTTNPGKTSQVGDIVLSIRASIGAKVWADGEYCLGRGVAGIRAKEGADRKYLWHALSSQERILASKGRGATFLQVNRSDIADLEIILPRIEEQRRIAAILDQADTIRAKRRQTLARLDTLTQSIFHEMFGDPRTNPFGFPLLNLGSLSEQFRDGPFGSNLKSEHYTEAGPQVIRLQNIGVGQYIRRDKAHISPEHYHALAKHHCNLGDVIIATLGDPNLRACILPGDVTPALNKADCVQMRVDAHKACPDWAVWLINSPGTLALAQSRIHGQTRSRVSMGQLRDLPVPVPPLDLQQEFAHRATNLSATRERVSQAIEADDRVFASLQSRAFRGEL